MKIEVTNVSPTAAACAGTTFQHIHTKKVEAMRGALAAQGKAATGGDVEGYVNQARNPLADAPELSEAIDNVLHPTMDEHVAHSAVRLFLFLS